MYHPIDSAFPFVKDLAVFKASVGDKDEIRHMEQPNGYTVSSYIVAGESTFDNPYALECRGLVFDQAGRLIARPLHKFFNLNERPGARPEDFDWSKLVRIMDKRDGSMIHTVCVDVRESPFSSQEVKDGMPLDQEHMTWGASAVNFTLKSKKSFESDVAVQARAWMTTRENFINFCQHVTGEGCTAIFEWTSPTARIVLPYSEEGLTLLHVRNNDLGTYWTPGHLEFIAAYHGVPVVQPTAGGTKQEQELFAKMLMGDRNPKQVLAAVHELQETVENVEGWVFQFEDGQMVKVKTKWYMERHRAMTFLRERDIVGAVLNESLDDLKAMLASEGVDISEIVAIENNTVSELATILHGITAEYNVIKHMTKKEAALRLGPNAGNHPHFGLLMKMMDGKEPDVKGWYERNVLPHVSLRQLNLLQSVAEAE